MKKIILFILSLLVIAQLNSLYAQLTPAQMFPAPVTYTEAFGEIASTTFGQMVLLLVLPRI